MKAIRESPRCAVHATEPATNWGCCWADYWAGARWPQGSQMPAVHGHPRPAHNLPARQTAGFKPRPRLEAAPQPRPGPEHRPFSAEEPANAKALIDQATRGAVE
jgi:hypothetical protein